MSLILIGHLSLHGLAWIVILTLVHQVPSSSLDYCEGELDFNNTIFVHPFNTWSNVSFFFVAWLQAVFMFLWKVSKREFIYTLILPIVTLQLALASFLYHSILYEWTAHWDVIAIFIYLGFELGTSLTRVLEEWGWKGYLLELWRVVIWVLSAAIASIITYAVPGFDEGIGNAIGAGICVFGIVVLELIVLYVQRDVTTIYGKALYLGIALFTIPAVIVWQVGVSPHPAPCEAHIYYVGHGTWHILISVSIFLLFLTRLVIRRSKSGRVIWE